MSQRDPYLDTQLGDGGTLLPDAEADFNIADYVEKIRRRWKLIAVTCILCLSAGAVHYSITPKEYRASAQIQIERRSLSPLVTNSQFAWLENMWNLEYYPTQYRLLESRGLAERVVEDLRLAEDPFFNPGGAALATGDNELSGRNQIDLVRARLANRLRGGLSVSPARSTQLVTLSYRSSNPEFAARAVNGFAEAFVEWGVANRTETASRASDFLGSQIALLNDEIKAKQQQLQSFGRASDIVDLDPQSNVTLQRVETLNQDYIAAKGDRITERARLEELRSAPRESVATSGPDGMINDLQREKVALEREYETKLQTYKPDWPAMVDLRADIQQIQERIDQVIDQNVDRAIREASARYQTALRRENELKREIDRQRGEALNQQTAAAQFSSLQVEIDTRRELLNQLLLRQSETSATADLQTTGDSNIRIIDFALVPGGPFRPSLRNDLTLGLMAGLLLGLGLVFLLDYMDRTIKTPEELERRLRLPNLAAVPEFAKAGKSGYGYGYGNRLKRGEGRGKAKARGKKDADYRIELLPHDQPRLAVSEAYRSLRTALLLSSAEELKLLSVTSSSAGEGKTVTASNLAVVLAQLGRQVLILDGDLRKPRLHEVFGVSRRSGLVNYLTGTAEIDSLVQVTRVPNLFMVPSGPIPPNPSELIASERMQDLLRRLRSKYDYVLIDTPPVLAVTDPTIIGSMTDGVVFCIRAGKTTSEDARTARDRLMLSDVKILGTILNRHSEGTGYRRNNRYYEAYIQEAQTDSAA